MPKLVNNQVNAEYYLVEDPATIGRHESNDVVLPAPPISRFHLEFGSSDEGFYVQDLGSSYGTYLNERRITGRAEIADGDRLQLGITSSYPNGAFDFLFRNATAPPHESASVAAVVAARDTLDAGCWTYEELDNVLIVKLYGHLRQTVCDAIFEAISEKARGMMCDVVLDCEDVDHMNSHAIGSLLNLRTELLRLGKQAVIANSPAIVNKILNTLGLTGDIGCYASVQLALESVQEFSRVAAKSDTRDLSRPRVVGTGGDEERAP